ncbi:MAG: 3-dehydroquinate synthase [Candidatus Nanopelagicales bacterium]|nr:3-dehydroquinate synthase [Candidatus Nanopelagicales bacterium]
MASEPTRIRVTGGGDYDVIIGGSLEGQLIAVLPSSAARVVIVHTESVAPIARQVVEVVAVAGKVPTVIEIPDGEAAKTVLVAAACWDKLGAAGFTRSDLVIGVGGGATTDLAGFVAATWLRGVALVQVPTTLLAMVDAAVGGKTGINIGAGKNLVGSFHSPVAVVIDPSVLATVPVVDHVTGLAEVVKAGLIRDPVICDLIEADPAAAVDPASELTVELITRSVRVKAEVVSDDFREAGGLGEAAGSVAAMGRSSVGREMLNYGHTLAHAIERAEGYRIRHGSAVSIGMVFAAELAGLTGHLGEAEVVRHRRLLTSLGLPVEYRQDRWPELLESMRLDKKTRAHTLRFVILDGIGRPVILTDPPAEILETAFRRLVLTTGA